MRRSILHIAQILEWADAHYKRTGDWPDEDSGQVWETPDEKWININNCLRIGYRGLRPGGSLAKLLAKHRGRRNRKALPKYTVDQILKWADAHFDSTNRWPHRWDGPIAAAPGETWVAVDTALRNGQRGMRGGSSLARLLAATRKVPNHAARPRMSVRRILRWADEHFRRTGNWPTEASGPIPNTIGETWRGVTKALRKGRRGLRRSSLATLLAKERGVSSKYRRQPPLSADQILAWADSYHVRTGKWPRVNSGKIPGTSETWDAVHRALSEGRRGLPGGETLVHFLSTRRKLRTKVTLPKLSEEQVLNWARAFQRRYGYWPTRESGVIPGSAGETWCGIDNAFKRAGRGLPREGSLSQFLRRRFDIRVSRLVRPKKLAEPSSR